MSETTNILLAGEKSRDQRRWLR